MKNLTSPEIIIKMNKVREAFNVRKTELELITRKKVLIAIMELSNVPAAFIDTKDTKATMIDIIIHRQFGKQFTNLKYRLAKALRAEAKVQALAIKSVKVVKAPKAVKATTVPEGYSYELGTDGKFYLKHNGQKIGKSAKGWFATTEAKAVEWLNKIAIGAVAV